MFLGETKNSIELSRLDTCLIGSYYERPGNNGIESDLDKVRLRITPKYNPCSIVYKYRY